MPAPASTPASTPAPTHPLVSPSRSCLPARGGGGGGGGPGVQGGTAIYHPIGNVVYVTQKPHSIKGVRRNTYLVAFVVTDGESPIGSSTCKYYW